MNYKLTVETSCPSKPKRTTKIKCTYEGPFEFNEDDISAYDSECELCGSHGSVEISLTCPSCGHRFDLEIKSW